MAIIGGGSSGLCAAKYAFESGFQPVIFEKSAHFGGVWSPIGQVWSQMHTNVGSYLSSFADFPWPPQSPLFPSSGDVFNYLLAYAEKFDLLKHVRFNAEVIKIEQPSNDDDNDKWQITLSDQSVESFDYCVISTGFNSRPILPQYPNQAAFKGKILHANDYDSNDEELKGKRVVVVGCAFSAIEIVTDLVGHASHVLNLFRRPYLIFPKIIRTKCGDDDEQNNVKVRPIDTFFFNRHCYYDILSKRDQESLEEKRKLFKQLSPIQTDPKSSPPSLFIDLDDSSSQDSYFKTNNKMAISEDYMRYLSEERIETMRGEIEEFKANGIVVNDTFIEADCVLFCTSYGIETKFFDAQTLEKLHFDSSNPLNPLVLYNVTWPHQLGHNLAFCGLFRGSNFLTAELQAKWIFKVFSGALQLPDESVMRAAIEQDVEKRRQNPHAQYPYPGILVSDRIAREFGAMPDLEAMKERDPTLYGYLWRGPFLPQHFLLNDVNGRQFALSEIERINERLERDYSLDEAKNISIQNFKY